MNELHLSLLIIGLIFIAAVFIFNYWQERKYRKQTEKMFGGERQDVLLDEPQKKAGGERIEPSFAASSGSGAPPVAPAAGGGAPSTASRPTAPPPAPTAGAGAPSITSRPAIPPLFSKAPPLGMQKWPAVGATSPSAPARSEPPAAAIPAIAEEELAPHGLIDEAIDLVGSIRLDQAVLGDRVQGLMAQARTFSKAVHWEGMETGHWTEVAPDSHYRELKIALQLADRRGPAASADISRFIALVKQFAIELDGSAQMEAEESAAARAAELDDFCADVDVEIGVNVIAGDHAMQATKLRALAESSGLKLNVEGMFESCDENGALQFTLGNSEPRPFLPDLIRNITTRGITMLLDVPRVADGVQAFDQMLKLARHIANALDGAVVDDNRKPLTDAGADAIRRQLALIYRQMEGYGITAGSPLALRLFS